MTDEPTTDPIIIECFNCNNLMELEKQTWIDHITIGNHILCDKCLEEAINEDIPILEESTPKKKIKSFNEIAEELANAIEQLADENEIVSWLEFSKERRSVKLMSATGWPGSNDKERAAVQAKTLAEDEILLHTNHAIQLHKSKVILTKGRIDSLEALRRGIEATEQSRQFWNNITQK